MIRQRRRILVCGLTLTLAAPLTAQAPVHLKLATLAPENSPWHTALADMGADWTRATSGRIVLTIYAGNSVDSESSAIAKMNPAVDSLQAATLSVGGLGQIDEAFNVFGMPFFFESDSELDAVQRALTPTLARRLEARGYQLLSWGNAGWIRLFSKTPIRTWAEAKRAKLYTSEGDARTVQWYTQNGFHAVPLKQKDIPQELKPQGGSIDATPSPPYFAMALQFYRDAPCMLDVPLAPFVSATVITARAWEKISPEDRARMLEIAADAGRKVQAQAPTLEADAIREMRDSTRTATVPFRVITLDSAPKAQFRAEAAALTASQRGTLVPADVFDTATAARTAFRQSRVAN
jgi:TRAP-type transport system periplasmic protein